MSSVEAARKLGVPTKTCLICAVEYIYSKNDESMVFTVAGTARSMSSFASTGTVIGRHVCRACFDRIKKTGDGGLLLEEAEVAHE